MGKLVKTALLTLIIFYSCTEHPSNRKIIQTPKAPQAIGPYSQAVQIENTVYLAGQIAIDPESGEMIEGDISEQTHRVMQNIIAVLDEAGFKIDDIVKCQIFLADLDDYGAMNKVYASYFKNHYPARAVVEVSRIPRDGLIEIMVTAVKSD